MYEFVYTGQFKRSLRRCVKRGLDLSLLQEVLDLLRLNGELLSRFSPHKLSGKYHNCWECHIQPDWLLVWQRNNTELVLILLDTGTHADIFRVCRLHKNQTSIIIRGINTLEGQQNGHLLTILSRGRLLCTQSGGRTRTDYSTGV